MPVFSNLNPTTETEAVNEMLAAIGEAPIADVNTSTQTDVETAINLLREIARNVQSDGWRFNSEFGYEVIPSDTLVWIDSEGSTTLNIFEPPAGLLSWELTRTADQLGLLVSERPSRVYAPVGTPVFYDRRLNRDGFDEALVDSLYIDPVWLFDFDQLPQTARAYITALGARRLVEVTAGAEAPARLNNDEIARYFRALKKDQGVKRRTNLFDSVGSRELFGGRSRGFGGGIPGLDSPNHI